MKDGMFQRREGKQKYQISSPEEFMVFSTDFTLVF